MNIKSHDDTSNSQQLKWLTRLIRVFAILGLIALAWLLTFIRVPWLAIASVIAIGNLLLMLVTLMMQRRTTVIAVTNNTSDVK